MAKKRTRFRRFDPTLGAFGNEFGIIHAGTQTLDENTQANMRKLFQKCGFHDGLQIFSKNKWSNPTEAGQILGENIIFAIPTCPIR